MHPVPDFYGRDVDYTSQFRELCLQISAEAEKAARLSDCQCPYSAESQMARILSLLREATKITSTVSDYFMRIPKSREKDALVGEAWDRASKIDAALAKKSSCGMALLEVVKRLRDSAKANKKGDLDWTSEEVGSLQDEIADEIVGVLPDVAKELAKKPSGAA